MREREEYTSYSLLTVPLLLNATQATPLWWLSLRMETVLQFVLSHTQTYGSLPVCPVATRVRSGCNARLKTKKRTIIITFLPHLRKGIHFAWTYFCESDFRCNLHGFIFANPEEKMTFSCAFIGEFGSMGLITMTFCVDLFCRNSQNLQKFILTKYDKSSFIEMILLTPRVSKSRYSTESPKVCLLSEIPCANCTNNMLLSYSFSVKANGDTNNIMMTKNVLYQEGITMITITITVIMCSIFWKTSNLTVNSKKFVSWLCFSFPFPSLTKTFLQHYGRDRNNFRKLKNQCPPC